MAERLEATCAFLLLFVRRVLFPSQIIPILPDLTVHLEYKASRAPQRLLGKVPPTSAMDAKAQTKPRDGDPRFARPTRSQDMQPWTNSRGMFCSHAARGENAYLQQRGCTNAHPYQKIRMLDKSSRGPKCTCRNQTHHAPKSSFGRHAKTVLTIPIAALTTSSAQLPQYSARPSSLPKSLR
jgi:hypothetical protein